MHMYENGVDEKVNQYFMGHEEIATTRHYDRRKPKKPDPNEVNSVFGFELPASMAEDKSCKKTLLLAITRFLSGNNEYKSKE